MCSLVMSLFSRDFYKNRNKTNQSIRNVLTYYYVYSIHTAPGF